MARSKLHVIRVFIMLFMELLKILPLGCGVRGGYLKQLRLDYNVCFTSISS
jgi:hypothetical protein